MYNKEEDSYNISMTSLVVIYKSINSYAAANLFENSPVINISFQIDGKEILTISQTEIYEDLSHWHWQIPTEKHLQPEQLEKVMAILCVNSKKYDFAVTRATGVEMVDGTVVGRCKACLNMNEKGEWEPLLEIGLNRVI